MKNNIKGENCWPRGDEAKRGEERGGCGGAGLTIMNYQIIGG